MELWFTEKQTPSLALSCLVKSTVYREKTKYQDLAILDTVEYGRMLALDGIIMTTEKDEFFYHEMITHVAMHTHARPEQVLVVGGGDGGTVREVLKHPTVSRVVLAEIDEGVVNAARKYLPTLAQGLSDPRVEIQITDAIVYVREHPGEFDVVIVDSTDPIGPGVGLFTREFYQDVAKALKDGGIMVAQTESPVNNKDLIQKIHRNLQGFSRWSVFTWDRSRPTPAVYGVILYARKARIRWPYPTGSFWLWRPNIIHRKSTGRLLPFPCLSRSGWADPSG